jgi:hypothetical protein
LNRQRVRRIKNRLDLFDADRRIFGIATHAVGMNLKQVES